MTEISQDHVDAVLARSQTVIPQWMSRRERERLVRRVLEKDDEYRAAQMEARLRELCEPADENEEVIAADTREEPREYTFCDACEGTAVHELRAELVRVTAERDDLLAERDDPIDGWERAQFDRATVERDEARERVVRLRAALVALKDACVLWAGDESSDGSSLLPRRVQAALVETNAALVELGETQE